MGRKNGTLFTLALRDLLHEAVISLCLVFSVAAVLAPILLLLSVKVGFIDSLRQDFIEDPSFREISPASADLRTSSLFDKISTWDGVEYVVPTVLMTPREAVWISNSGNRPTRGQARLVPSTAADPILRNLIGDPPAADGFVATESVISDANLEIGDSIEISVVRIENDQRISKRLPLVLLGSLPDDTFSSPAVLVPPLIDQQVEAFRSGVPVPERGWAGTRSEPAGVYQYIVVMSQKELGETNTSNLAIRIGAKSIENITQSQLAAVVGVGALGIEDGSWLYLMTPNNSGYFERDVVEANAVLSNFDGQAIGVVEPRNLYLLDAQIEAAAFPAGLASTEASKVEPRGLGFALNNSVLLPNDLYETWQFRGASPEIDVEFRFMPDSATASLKVPLRVVGKANDEKAWVSPNLLSAIGRADRISLSFDKNEFRLYERSAGFRGFRIISRTIDDVPPIVDKLSEEGIEVRAKSSQILRLQRLETSLNLLILVVSSVSLLGGLAILSSSFFANVQRKKVDYATFRLLGMAKATIARIPIYQALVVAVLGYVVSVCIYFVISEILNGPVATQLEFSGHLSMLFIMHFFGAFLIVAAAALLASLFASRAATKIDPAQALRGAN